MDETDVWVANDEGTEIVRARDIASVGLDYDGNVTVRLTRGDGVVVTIAGHRTHHEENRPDDLLRVCGGKCRVASKYCSGPRQRLRPINSGLCSGIRSFSCPGHYGCRALSPAESWSPRQILAPRFI